MFRSQFTLSKMCNMKITRQTNTYFLEKKNIINAYVTGRCCDLTDFFCEVPTNTSLFVLWVYENPIPNLLGHPLALKKRLTKVTPKQNATVATTKGSALRQLSPVPRHYQWSWNFAQNATPLPQLLFVFVCFFTP